MPTRAATSTTTAVVETEGNDEEMPGLQFNEPLSWRAGKPIAIPVLLRRLEALFKELRSMEQDENERDSLTTVAKDLASPNLLGHKDRGVKAWTACCLVEILRLCAPDAPFTGQQLKDIFTMIIRVILPALSDPSNAYNNQHLHVLESLAQVKSIILLTDIPSSEELTENLFASFFDILAGSSKASTGELLGKNVEFNMTSILVVMVDESQTLSTEVIDVIIAQFLRTDPRALNGTSGKSKKNGIPALDDKQLKLVLRDLPPAYNMAKTICNTCPDKMGRHISQYFNDVILDAATTSSTKFTSKGRKRRSNSIDDSDDEPKGPTEEDLKDLDKAHNLLRELWRASPAVLQNVIPQLETELSAENVQLRFLATETLGDIISGIGAGGLPPPPTMDPSAYPPLRLSDSPETRLSQNLLNKPSSPLQFPQAHPQAYSSFLRRKHDKSPVIRSAWTTEIGRILSTSAGDAGLSQGEEQGLIEGLAHMLVDADEKVRLAAVKVVGTFSLKFVIDKLGPVTYNNSVIGNLAERVRDRKHAVRSEAMRVLARIWGVAAGEIATGEEKVISCIAAVPSRILDTFYANDMEINALLDRAIFEQLLPLGYPPIKSKAAKNVNGNSQRAKEGQSFGENEVESVDPDKIRTERILILVKQLDERAKKVFFALQTRQIMLAKVMTAYLQRCEDFNGGVMDENEAQIKHHLTRLIDEFSKFLPDPSKTKDHLWKFAKLHDRRSYQLVRFCIAPESDYRIVFNAIKEFTKRIEQSAAAPAGILDTLTPLLYRVGVIIYNKSHVPAIMEYSRSDEKSLAATAHEVLREISSRTPEVLKAHVQEICKILEEQAPGPQKANDLSAVDDLKACASFASKFAGEIPRGRKFVQAMTNFALLGTPPEAAKYAVSIIITSSDKRELLARELVQKCVKDFEYGGEGFLSRLASLSQLMLLAPNEVDVDSDSVIDIAIQRILLQVRTPSTEPPHSYKWSETVDAECEAKCWALKILVNRIRSHNAPETLSEHAAPVYSLLSTLISEDGEVSTKKNTPSTHKSRLRLLASRLYLKLCTQKSHDSLLIPADFNALAFVAQDPKYPVRSGFLQRLKKYLLHGKLQPRFYAIPFLLAYEPIGEFKHDCTTWIRSRASFFSNLKSQSSSLGGNTKAVIVMESVFARLISLLAHHPDYGSSSEDLVSFSRYIIFYLQTVATEENLSLIYHIAERVKQYRDAVLPDVADSPSPLDSNLYHLSDLAQLTIRKYEDAHSWTIQTLPAKIRLPSSLFAELKDHEEAQRIAERNHLPEDVEEGVEALLRAEMRAARFGGKKRKSDVDLHAEGREVKRAKGLPIRKSEGKEKKGHRAAPGTKAMKTPKTPKNKEQAKPKTDKVETSGERRRSGRVKPEEKNYVERSDAEDDDEMEVLSWEYLDGSEEQSRELDESGDEEHKDAEKEVKEEGEQGGGGGGEDDDAENEKDTPEKKILNSKASSTRKQKNLETLNKKSLGKSKNKKDKQHPPSPEPSSSKAVKGKAKGAKPPPPVGRKALRTRPGKEKELELSDEESELSDISEGDSLP